MKVLEDTFSLIYVPTCSLTIREVSACRSKRRLLCGVKGRLFRRFFFFLDFFLSFEEKRDKKIS
jgi:hypothetical protein